MTGFARFLERKATFVYLILFAGIMWPPDAYFSGTMVDQQGSRIFTMCSNSPC